MAPVAPSSNAAEIINTCFIPISPLIRFFGFLTEDHNAFASGAEDVAPARRKTGRIPVLANETRRLLRGAASASRTGDDILTRSLHGLRRRRRHLVHRDRKSV